MIFFILLFEKIHAGGPVHLNINLVLPYRPIYTGFFIGVWLIGGFWRNFENISKGTKNFQLVAGFHVHEL